MSDEPNPIAEQVEARRKALAEMEQGGMPKPPWAEGDGSGASHIGPIAPPSEPSEFEEARSAGIGEPVADDGGLDELAQLREKAKAEGHWPEPTVEQAPEGAVEISHQMAEQAASEPTTETTTVEQQGTGVTQEPREPQEPSQEPQEGEADPPVEPAEPEYEEQVEGEVEPEQSAWGFEVVAEKLQDGEWAVIDDRLVDPTSGEDFTDKLHLSDDQRAELGLPPNPGELVPYAQPPAVIEDAEEVEAEGVETEQKGLFDQQKYDDPRLKLQSDNRNVDKIAVAFSGTVMLDRNNPDHVDVIRQAKIGAEMNMAIAGVDGTWAGHADVAKMTDDGYVEEVTRTVKLKVTDVVFDQASE